MNTKQLVAELIKSPSVDGQRQLMTSSPTPSAFASPDAIYIDTTMPLRSAVVDGEETAMEYDLVADMSGVTDVIHELPQ